MKKKHIEYHISECCKADLFFKGVGNGFWCSKCKKEITRTFVAYTEKEMIELQKIRDEHNPTTMNHTYEDGFEERVREELRARFQIEAIFGQDSFTEKELVKYITSKLTKEVERREREVRYKIKDMVGININSIHEEIIYQRMFTGGGLGDFVNTKEYINKVQVLELLSPKDKEQGK